VCIRVSYSSHVTTKTHWLMNWMRPRPSYIACVPSSGKRGRRRRRERRRERRRRRRRRRRRVREVMMVIILLYLKVLGNVSNVRVSKHKISCPNSNNLSALSPSLLLLPPPLPLLLLVVRCLPQFSLCITGLVWPSV